MSVRFRVNDLQYLIEREYRTYEYKEGRIIEHRLKERYPYADILLLPKHIHNRIE